MDEGNLKEGGFALTNRNVGIILQESDNTINAF
jgi:hypothetical protein